MVSEIETAPEPAKKIFDLDEVLVNEIGQFGKFQLFNVLLVAVPVIMTGFMADYLFAAGAVPHRCMIPECGENSKDAPFNPQWIRSAIPTTSSGLASCQRYRPLGNGTSTICPTTLFDQTATIPCDGYVYSGDKSVVYEFDLGCNELLRTLAGTFNSIGSLICLPITGFISDRYGRKVALVMNIFNLSLLGLIRAFLNDYTTYLVFQLLQAALGSGIFGTAFICATELVGPKYRVLTGVTCSAMFAVGQIITGLMAWTIDSWRNLIIVLYSPCFLFVGYYWILSESVRWLISKGKCEEAVVILKKVAQVNKREISEKTLQAVLDSKSQRSDDKTNPRKLISTVYKSKVLRRRVCTTPIWWMTAIFVYYGLSINAASLSDSIYLNVILTSAVEIPGFYSGLLLLDRIGRRNTVSGGFFLSFVCCYVFVFIPNAFEIPRLIVYLLGKFGISLVITSIYLYTSELYPTEYRHTLLAFSSMLGRIGAIIAPLTPALMVYWHGIPLMLFGSMAFISCGLVLTQPDTLGTKMPDTLAESEALGTK